VLFRSINKYEFVRMGKKCTPASGSSTLPRRTWPYMQFAFLKPLKVSSFKHLFYITGACILYVSTNNWSSSGISETVDETAVLPSVSSIFSVNALVYAPTCPMVMGSSSYCAVCSCYEHALPVSRGGIRRSLLLFRLFLL
jgi:hypothetical protein